MVQKKYSFLPAITFFERAQCARFLPKHLRMCGKYVYKYTHTYTCLFIYLWLTRAGYIFIFYIICLFFIVVVVIVAACFLLYSNIFIAFLWIYYLCCFSCNFTFHTLRFCALFEMWLGCLRLMRANQKYLFILFYLSSAWSNFLYLSPRKKDCIATLVGSKLG